METDDHLFRLRYKPADLMRWESALRRLGPEIVRLRLDEQARPGARNDQAIPGLVPEAPYPPAEFVERWLRGQSVKVMNARTMLPAICVGIVLAFVSLFAFWTMNGALQNPITTPPGTQPAIGTAPPTIGAALSTPPPVSQVTPPPGANTTGTPAAPQAPGTPTPTSD